MGGRGWRVLVVDDYIDTAEVIAYCFQLLGCESRFATTGRAALDLARSIEPHMVIIDLVLPDLDGFDVARELRRGSCRHSYLVALTGRVRADVRACARHSGFDRVLLKSIGLADIRELVDELAAAVNTPAVQA